MKTLILEKRGNIALLTLNRPDRYNAVSDQMVKELTDTFEKLEKDAKVRGLVITGAGKAFCGGADVGYGNDKKLKFANDPNPLSIHKGYRSMIPRLVRALRNLGIPTIAALNGVAVGMGCDTALACDIRIACENTKLASIWIKRGLLPAESGFWLLPRLVGLGRAAELIFSGRFIEAEEGERIGLFNKIVPAAKLIDESVKMCQSFAENPPNGLRLAKMVMYRALSMDMDTGLELAGACQSILGGSEDTMEALNAFREKRKPVFKGK